MMFRLTKDEIELEREAYAVESRKIWAMNGTREWRLKKLNELESCFSRVARTQVKKIADKIEDMANDGDSVGEILKALREEA